MALNQERGEALDLEDVHVDLSKSEGGAIGAAQVEDAIRRRLIERQETVPKIGENFVGLPIRPGGRICAEYYEYGMCGTGELCPYHHPEPELVQRTSKTSS